VIQVVEQLAMEPRERGLGRSVRIGVHPVRDEPPIPEIAIDVLGERGRGGEEQGARGEAHGEHDREPGAGARPAHDEPRRGGVREVGGAPEEQHRAQAHAEIAEPRDRADRDHDEGPKAEENPAVTVHGCAGSGKAA